MIETAQATLHYAALEAEYRATLREYRGRFGLTAALKVNERLTLGEWQRDPTEGRVERLTLEMRKELGNG